MNCPNCGSDEIVNIEGFDECIECGYILQEEDYGLIVTEVVELTADEYEEYKIHCDNNPMASYDNLTLEELSE